MYLKFLKVQVGLSKNNIPPLSKGILSAPPQLLPLVRLIPKSNHLSFKVPQLLTINERLESKHNWLA